MAEAKFFALSPGYHPLKGRSKKAFCETGNALDLFLPLDGIYAPTAQKFGDFLANNSNATLKLHALQLYGYLAARIANYPQKQGIKVGAHWFPRIVSAVVRISKVDDSVCGYLLRSIWLEDSGDVEDADMKEVRDGPNKDKILQERKIQRNPNHALCNLFNKGTHREFYEEHKFKKAARLWFHNLDKDSFVRDFADQIVPGMRDHDGAQKFSSLSRMGNSNPAGLHKVYSMDLALAEMKEHGCHPRFLNEQAWANNHVDFKNTEIWRVYPQELQWESLQSTFFVDRAQVDLDTTTAEFKYAVRIRKAKIVASHGAAAAGGTPEEKQLFEEKCEAEAIRDVKQAKQGSQRVLLETSNLKALAEANKKRIDDAIKAAREPLPGDDDAKVADRIGLARLRAQKECSKAFAILVEQDAALDESMVAVRNWLRKELAENGNKLYRPRQRRPEFSNLTPHGELLAELLVREETIHRSYMVHRQSLIVLLAALHTPMSSLLQANVLLLGEWALGKSFVVRAPLNDLIPKTTRLVSGSSDKAALSNNAAYFLNNKVDIAEEVEPSRLGLENANMKNTKKNDSAMTDKASRFRSGATAGGESGYDRLVQNPETKEWETVRISNQIVSTLIGCLNLQPHDVPGNVLSRFISMVFLQWQRGGNYQMASCKLADMPEEYKTQVAEHQALIRRLQMMIWWYALHGSTNEVMKIDYTVTKRFVEEVILLARERGVNGVNDFRVLDHIHSISESVTVLCCLWDFFSKPGSRIANLEYTEEIWHEVEKTMIPRIEHAAFALTLLGDLFETRVAYEVLSAINLTFQESPFHFQALAQLKTRKSGDKESSEDSDDEELSAVPASSSRNINPRNRQNDLGYDKDYFHFSVSVGRLDTLKQEERSRHFCDKIYEAIEAKIFEKPNRSTCIHYLQSLLRSTVQSNVDDSNITLLVIKETGECMIARALIGNVSSNRFVQCVQEVLSRRYYPKQRYVFGVQSAKAPFIYKTFSTNPADLPTKFQQDRYNELQARATATHEKQFGNMAMTEEERKKSEGWALSYKVAAQEQVLWNVVAKPMSAEQETDYYALFGDASRFKHSVDIIDMDREDYHASMWLAEKTRLTPSVAAQFVNCRTAADLQPSRCRALAQQHHEDTVNRLVAELGRKEGKEKAEAKRRSVEKDCSYPTCFQSRHAHGYRNNAIKHAVKNPGGFMLSTKSQRAVLAAGLGFQFDGVAPAPESKRQQQQRNENAMRDDPRPPPPNLERKGMEIVEEFFADEESRAAMDAQDAEFAEAVAVVAPAAAAGEGKDEKLPAAAAAAAAVAEEEELAHASPARGHKRKRDELEEQESADGMSAMSMFMDVGLDGTAAEPSGMFGDIHTRIQQQEERERKMQAAESESESSSSSSNSGAGNQVAAQPRRKSQRLSGGVGERFKRMVAIDRENGAGVDDGDNESDPDVVDPEQEEEEAALREEEDIAEDDPTAKDSEAEDEKNGIDRMEEGDEGFVASPKEIAAEEAAAAAELRAEEAAEPIDDGNDADEDEE